MHLLQLLFLLVVLNRCAKVDDFERVVRLVVYNVLRFEVSVDYALVVAVRNSLEYLPDYLSCLMLGKPCLFLNSVEEF